MTRLSPEYVQELEAAFTPSWPDMLMMTLSSVPTAILLCLLLWVAWPQKGRE